MPRHGTGEMKQVSCRGCGRTVTVPYPAQGHPYGWYTVSVSVPPHLANSRNGAPYIYVGLFCCPDCLAGHLPVLQEARDLAAGVYDPD